MTEDEYSVLANKIDTLQKSVNRLDKDMASDRQDLQTISIRFGAVENQLDEFRKVLDHLPSRTKDRVEDAVQPIIDATDNLTESIEKNKYVPPVKKKSWWKFW